MEAETALECPACGFGQPLVYERGPHLRADCRQCGRYLKFVPGTREWLNVLNTT
jgi:uncharacterized Zn finger protein